MLLFALCIQQGTAQTVELNVLNYNVMMLQPLIAFPNHQQFFRAKQIPMALQRSGKTWDVVIFSESY